MQPPRASAASARSHATPPPSTTGDRARARLEPEPRRVVAALASAVVPGLGQAINGRARLGAWFAIPFAAVLIIAAFVVATQPGTRLFALVVAPQVLSILLAANLLICAWRLVAVGQAFFDGRYRPRPGKGASLVLVAIVVAVAVPHGIVDAWGNQARQAFAQVFAGDHDRADDRLPQGDTTTPVNVLLVGLDSAPGRTETLTDSLMVASFDPTGPRVGLVSLPRDLVGVPLGNGRVYDPKINSLLSYADNHPELYPEGGMRALEDAIGALLGIEIHYYVRIDLLSFVQLVDAVGGVDVDVKRRFYDPLYDGMGLSDPPKRGFGATVGLHHYNGYEALAYARARRGVGESDFTRAARQQEILLALRDKVTSGGTLLTELPELLAALGNLVETDIPTSRLPYLAAAADELEEGDISRMVVKKPLVRGATDPIYGSVQVPDLDAIREAVAALLAPPEPAASPTPTASG